MAPFCKNTDWLGPKKNTKGELMIWKTKMQAKSKPKENTL